MLKVFFLAFRAFVPVVGLAALPAILMAVVLLCVADVWHSRLFALGVAASVVTLWIVCVACFKRRRGPTIFLALLGCLATVVFFTFSRWMAPDGTTEPRSPFQVVTLDEKSKRAERPYFTWSPTNLVAEVDQLALGNVLFPLIDPRINRAKGQRIRHLFRGIYLEMREASPAPVAAGSDLGSVYIDIGLFDIRNGHGYVYVPPEVARKGEPVPVFLFLHGALGNFKAYTWILKDMADRQGMAIVSPSFGIGSWNRRGGLETINQWVEFCQKEPALDGDRIVLAGLSNGGRGVSRAWASNPEAFLGFVGISPVLKPEAVIAGRKAGSGRPLLVVHGDKDLRISEGFVLGKINQLTSAGAQCQYVPFPGEDHFLFFSQKDAVLGEIERWMAAELGIGSGAPVGANQ